MDINQEKIEKVIDLYVIYKDSSRKKEEQLRANGMDQVYIAIQDINNPDRDNLFDYINNLDEKEKNALIALMRFGEDLDIPSKEDFEYYQKYKRFTGEHDIDYMIGRPLSKYLTNGLMKLDLIKRNN